MNRIKRKLKENKKLLSIYFSAGFPRIDDTVEIIKELEKNNVDFIEIGLPFSDPLADGPTIQDSSSKALKNGMNTNYLFNQLANIRNNVKIPLIIMGYFNPILQYGVKEFCKKCEEVGIDGCIIPDLPVQIFHKNYKKIFDKYGLINIFLIPSFICMISLCTISIFSYNKLRSTTTNTFRVSPSISFRSIFFI